MGGYRDRWGSFQPSSIRGILEIHLDFQPGSCSPTALEDSFAASIPILEPLCIVTNHPLYYPERYGVGPAQSSETVGALVLLLLTWIRIVDSFYKSWEWAAELALCDYYVRCRV